MTFRAAVNVAIANTPHKLGASGQRSACSHRAGTDNRARERRLFESAGQGAMSNVRATGNADTSGGDRQQGTPQAGVDATGGASPQFLHAIR